MCQFLFYVTKFFNKIWNLEKKIFNICLAFNINIAIVFIYFYTYRKFISFDFYPSNC